MRASGILLPVTSLPSPYGIGCFSKEAYEFVDQLEKGGEKYWQILPLGPTGYGDSPYQSFSTFAGNPYFIDLEEFIQRDLLTAQECAQCDWGGSLSYVDYEKIYHSRFALLRKAYHRFYQMDTKKKELELLREEMEAFEKEQGFWLEDYCLYMAVKDSLNGIAWNEWPKELKTREEVAPYAKKLQEKGARNVLISMAGEGAVLVAENGEVFDEPAPKGTLVNGVGAGDSMVAGFLAGWLKEKDYRYAFHMGIATGSASAFSEYLATREQIEEVYRQVTSEER